MKTAAAPRNHLWERSALCRERSGDCDASNGECLRCFAACGEACREPVIVAYRPEGER